MLLKSMVFLAALLMLNAGTGESYRLNNGLTVILRPIATAEQVAVVVLFNLGGDHDPAGRSGRAHLLEHLYCTAAAGDAPARNFVDIQKRYPAGYNQQTGSDYTVFAGVVKPELLALELRDAAARLSDLRMTDADLKREVPRVLQELTNMYGGIPALAGLNHVRMRLHPIPQGGRPGGSPDHIKAITLNELQQVWRDYYKPNNAILVLAGKFEVATVRTQIEQLFGLIPSGVAPPARLPGPPAQPGATHRIKVKPIMRGATGIVSIGYDAPLPENSDYAPFLVVVSRLWAQAQGEFRPGQVQPVHYMMLNDPTTIALQATLPATRDAAAILSQLDQRLQAALAPKLEPLDQLQAVNSMAMLGTVDVPDAMWTQNLYGLAFSVGRRHQMKIDGQRLREAIGRVTDADIERLAKSVFPPEKRIAVIVEPEEPVAMPGK